MDDVTSHSHCSGQPVVVGVWASTEVEGFDVFHRSLAGGRAGVQDLMVLELEVGVEIPDSAPTFPQYTPGQTMDC